ncbi:hypothetical protein M231_01953 [Tremella mesenterica]|uniref:Cytochrome c oxidase assembly factor 5 n=1 Tax=Tremella mesenterica TaxID=5217 RepID=A0A4Q1BRT4_TREME|nr:uncharacterized protein TREMEDRAFT_24680 [Tremella mesenterica DSM 1558]EIW73417.1 hypothetical protein TREMEDRAFT_24680 [Tremella mesenterica DSM 1558]RXK40701.1 hypothetical protein M231_01953 [Tremella mesenterica]
MTKEACQGLREELVSCVLRSDCVLKIGKTPGECIKERNLLPAQCQHLITSFTDCKKGMLDMRRRFRGNYISTDTATSSGDGLLGVVDIAPGEER